MPQDTLGMYEILGAKRAEILRIAAQHKAFDVRVFGSVARGEATPTSDVDFLVRFRPDYRLWDHIGLSQALSDLLGRRVDVCTDDTLKAGLRDRILHEAVPL